VVDAAGAPAGGRDCRGVTLIRGPCPRGSGWRADPLGALRRPAPVRRARHGAARAGIRTVCPRMPDDHCGSIRRVRLDFDCLRTWRRETRRPPPRQARPRVIHAKRTGQARWSRLGIAGSARRTRPQDRKTAGRIATSARTSRGYRDRPWAFLASSDAIAQRSIQVASTRCVACRATRGPT